MINYRKLLLVKQFHGNFPSKTLSRRERKTVFMDIKLDNLLPEFIFHNFTMSSEIACRSTRSTPDNKLFSPKANKVIYASSLEHSGPII